MSLLLTSRRLRRGALFRWALLLLPLCFLIVHVLQLEGVSKVALFCFLFTVAVLPFVLIHFYLNFLENKRDRLELENSDAEVFLSVKSAERTEKTIKSNNYRKINSTPMLQAADRSSAEKHIPDANASGDKGVNVVADTEVSSTVEEVSGRVDLDGTYISAESFSADIGPANTVTRKPAMSVEGTLRSNRDGTDRSSLKQNDKLSLARTNLTAATNDVDTTHLSGLSHSEVSRLAAALQKDRVRLHNLVIAQQEAVNSARKAYERSQLVGRESVRVMKISRKMQKQAERAAENERIKRIRIEEEYQKVSDALNHAKSIIDADGKKMA